MRLYQVPSRFWTQAKEGGDASGVPRGLQKFPITGHGESSTTGSPLWPFLPLRVTILSGGTRMENSGLSWTGLIIQQSKYQKGSSWGVGGKGCPRL